MKTRIMMLGSILTGMLWFTSCRSEAYDHYSYPPQGAYREEYREPYNQPAPAYQSGRTERFQAPAGQSYGQAYAQEAPQPPPMEEPPAGDRPIQGQVSAEQPAYPDQPAAPADPHAGHYGAGQPAAQADQPAYAEQPAQPYPPQQPYSDSGQGTDLGPAYPYQYNQQAPPADNYAASEQYYDDRRREDNYDDRYYDQYRYDNERRPSIGYEYFYQRLSPYGDWVHHRRYGWVWSPRGVSVGWRPYAVGHWVWTDDYGWMWDSDERWGWATYHYGRWASDGDFGWCWVPGYTWSPAWVVWRHSPRYVGWAPIPPEVGISFHLGFHMDVGYSERYIRPYHWNFIGEHDFCERDYSRYMISPAGNVVIINNTTNITNYTIVNNHIVNKSVRVDEIERASRKQVPKYRVSRTDSLVAHGNVRDNNTLQVFAPTVKTDSRMKEPPREIASRSNPSAVKQRHSRSEQAFQTVLKKETQEIRQGKRTVDAPSPELVSIPDNARRSKREAVAIPAGDAGRVRVPGGGTSTPSAPSSAKTATTPKSASVTPTSPATAGTGRTSRRSTIATPPSSTLSTPSTPSTPSMKASERSRSGRVIVRPTDKSSGVPSSGGTPAKTGSSSGISPKSNIQSTPPQSKTTTSPPAFSKREPRSYEAGPKTTTTPPTSSRSESKSKTSSDLGSARIRQSSPPPAPVRTGPTSVIRSSGDPTPRIQVRPIDSPPSTTASPKVAQDSTRNRVPVRPDTSRQDNAPDFRSFRNDTRNTPPPASSRTPDSRAAFRIPESSRSYTPPPSSRSESRPAVEIRRPSVPESRPSSPPPSVSRPSVPDRPSRSESARSDSGSSSRGNSDSDKGDSKGRGK